MVQTFIDIEIQQSLKLGNPKNLEESLARALANNHQEATYFLAEKRPHPLVRYQVTN